jgi:hypothetical protein
VAFNRGAHGGSIRDFQCQASTHPTCASCGGVVLRNSHHVHLYFPQHRRHEVRCGECNAGIAAAALPVLRAITQRGWAVDPVTIQRLFAEDLAQVLVQPGFW